MIKPRKHGPAEPPAEPLPLNPDSVRAVLGRDALVFTNQEEKPVRRWRRSLPDLLILPATILMGHVVGPAVQRHDWLTVSLTVVSFVCLVASRQLTWRNGR